MQKEVSSRSAYSPYPPPPSLPLSITTNLSSSPASSIASPSPASSKLHRSPYIPSRRTLSNASVADSRPWSSITPAESRVPSTPSVVSSTLEDVFAPGDIFGEGTLLQGEIINLVSIGAVSDRPPTPEHEAPAREFEVVRRLGAGSYAVVYLVCEVLSRPSSDDGSSSIIGSMDMEGKARSTRIEYGREYAIKCLSKANLDEDALAAQMSEVTIHQSLRSHPNIVTLHRTLETSSFLLLLLEFVPGEDLFYFLEQARDHYDENENDSSTSADSSCSSRTPPTPSLLSNLNPSQQLSRTRLRLISSMFSQMCDAVAACHDQQVFHRDIKPENFIVTDGWNATPDGRQERKVVVKLTDFGLSTTDIESSDMDCGSAPYMSYECRNNLAPTYRPRAADVWSLGIVLINITFSLYLRDPVNFFMNRFTGMTRRVAEVLTTRVFNILENPKDDSTRFTASSFGAWIKELPDLLSDQPPAFKGHQRTVSVSSITHGFPISISTPMSHRPSSRQVSAGTTVRTPAIPSRSLSRAPSFGAGYERYEQPEIAELSTVIDQEVEEMEDQPERAEDLTPAGMTSRSTSTNKRRKRGARKGKGIASTPGSVKGDVDDTLNTLAEASQSLARELSRTSKVSVITQTASIKSSSTKASSSKSKQAFEPVSMYGFPAPLVKENGSVSSRTISSGGSSGSIRSSIAPSSLRTSSVAPPPSAAPTKKPSKWKLSFGKTHTSPLAEDSTSSVAQPGDSSAGSNPHMSQTASQVSSLIMGLNAPAPHTPASAQPSADDATSWRRGRRGRSPPRSSAKGARPPLPSYMVPDQTSERAVSPNSARSGRPVASSSSSVASSNWRSSMSTTSSAGTSSSAFTRYSNSSARSISTAATSMSSASWRTNGRPNGGPSSASDHSHPSTYSQTYSGVPKNIKIMDGVPWELFELPRGQRAEPIGEAFNGNQNPPSSPAPRKQRSRKKLKDNTTGLDTISERAPSHKVPPAMRRDAATSTSDLTTHGSGGGGGGDDNRPQKALQKQQINALGRMLSALRR
ncbi:hypothetical protein V5O48_000190 [Marasmius crinis-equi]|uniref:Protein kinase domain-containing protein n=1 Tax=Marasmius crinis-equi TaxID=585013 RepID=A0ABR3G1Z6_9AGAR